MLSGNDDTFQVEREQLNELVLDFGGQFIKKFYSLDAQAYNDGMIPAKYKELMGLVASLVLRCDDCISYHLNQAKAIGINDTELKEALNIALIAGGSITIPHLRRAVKRWVEMHE